MTRATISSLKVISWNMNGNLRDKVPIIKQFAKDHDIVCIQEHFLSKDSLDCIKFSDKHRFFIREAKSSCRGRPSGGIAIVIKDHISAKLVEQQDSFIAVDVYGIVLICVYLPTNYKNDRSERKFNLSCEKLAKCVLRIKQSGHEYLIIGDFNCDLTDTDSPRTQIALGVLPDGFKVVDKDKNFSYCHNSGSVSNLDHVVTSFNVQNESVSVLMGGTLSDHLPISLSFACPFSEVKKSAAPKLKVVQDWKLDDAAIQQYQQVCNSILEKIQVPFPLLMSNSDIPVEEQKLLLNIYSASICHALRCAESAAVPSRKVRVNTEIRGWSANLNLTEACQTAKFWFRLWCDSGKPRSGQVWKVKNHTKRAFAKALSKHRRDIIDEYSKKSKSDPKLLWRNLVKPKESTSEVPLPTKEAWNTYFTDQFKSPDQALRNSYRSELDEMLKLPKENMVVNRSIIRECLKKLKKKFSRGFDKICGQHLLYGSEQLLEHVSLLFQIIVTRGIVPDTFCIGVITPILKPGKPPSQCSSYRPITVSTTLCKLFELLIRDEIRSKCSVPPHQFGFQRSLGCDHALYSLVSILTDAENDNDSLVLAAHDLARAFDSSIHEHILLSAAERGVENSVIGPLDSMYSNLRVRIKCPGWDCDMLLEIDIPVKKGIRQGAVNSPDLFNNSVIEVQHEAPTTCILCGIDVSLIGYADDILNISRTLNGIKSCFSALKVEYARVGHTFNPSKTELLFFNYKVSTEDICVMLDDTEIKPVPSLTYLGVPIGTSLKATRVLIIADTLRKVRSAYGKLVLSKARFSRDILARLYNAFVLPSFLYISPFWSCFTQTEKKKLRTIYFKYAKYLLGLPPWSKNRYLISRFGLIDPALAVPARVASFHKKFMTLGHPWVTLQGQT